MAEILRETDEYIEYIIEEDEDMEVKEFQGKVDEIIEKAGEKGVFYKAKVDGRTFNFNQKPLNGTTIKGKYTEHKYQYDGKEVTSKWVEDGFDVIEDTAPQNVPPAEGLSNFAKATEHVPDEKPDWKKISEGKVRHGVSIAFIEKGEELTEETIVKINDWVKFIMG